MLIAKKYAKTGNECPTPETHLDTLRKQADPHFLHNCLDNFYQLIHQDPNMAETYLEMLSVLHEYVLTNFNRPWVRMVDELEFIHSYYELNRLRFGENLLLQVNIGPEFFEQHIPPMSLQLLLENSIKHNSISAEAPLSVVIDVDPISGELVVTNNLQQRPKEERLASTGIGHSLLLERYRMISGKTPKILRTQHRYEVRLPLLKTA